MARYLIIFLLVLFALLGCKHNTKFTLIGGKHILAIIKDDKLDFYDIEKHNLALLSKSSFTVPKDNNGVFIVNNYTIGVVVKNKVKFYSNDDNGWHETSENSLTIPNDIDKIFGFGEYDWSSICVVKNNKVTFYQLGANEKWVKNDKKTLNLMDSVDNVFGLGSLSIGVVKNNLVYIYDDAEDDGNWKLNPNSHIPITKKGTHVIGLGYGIGMVNDDVIDFYTFSLTDRKWVTDPKESININDFVGK